MEGARTARGASHAAWWTFGSAGCGLAVLVLAFLPWFRLDAAQEGADLGDVLPVEQSGFSTLLGALAVLACVAGGVLVLLPAGAVHARHVAPCLAGAVLALVRLCVAPAPTVLGETLSYSRTSWLMLAAGFAVAQTGCAVLSASLRNQERVG
jgi:hypothetical protein